MTRPRILSPRRRPTPEDLALGPGPGVLAAFTTAAAAGNGPVDADCLRPLLHEEESP